MKHTVHATVNGRKFTVTQRSLRADDLGVQALVFPTLKAALAEVSAWKRTALGGDWECRGVTA